MADCPKCGKSDPPGTPLCGNCGESLSCESNDEVMKHLRSGRKIAAIKAYREQTGVGLKEAKDAVEAMAVEHEIAPKPSGCSGVVLLTVLLGGLAAWVC